MAEQPLILVGEALLDLLAEGFARLRPAARSIFEHLRHAAEPPPGVSFNSNDGASYTGLALLDHNRVTALLASRTEPGLGARSDRQERPPLITPPPAPPRSPYGQHQRSFYERDEPEEDDVPDWERDDRFQRYK